MAVSVLDAWSGPTASEPTGSVTISAGTSRLLVCCITYENSGQSVVSTFTVGGQTYTGVIEIFWDNGTADQYVGFYYWNEAAIDAMSGSTISYADSLVLTKVNFSFATFEGVDQTTPITDEASGNPDPVDQISLTTTSTANDYDVCAVSRSSANRDVTSWGALTQQWSYAIDYWTGLAHAAGGTTPIVVDGDGIADDFTHQLVVIKATAAGASVSDVNYTGVGRGIMRGTGRGTH